MMNVVILSLLLLGCVVHHCDCLPRKDDDEKMEAEVSSLLRRVIKADNDILKTDNETDGGGLTPIDSVLRSASAVSGGIKLFLKSGRGVTLSASNEVIQSPDNVVATTFQVTDCRAWNIVPEALRPRCVSLMDANRAGHYVRHRGYYLYVDLESVTNNLPLFQKDSSFIVHTDTFYPGYYAFESVNYAGYYIRLRGGRHLGIETAALTSAYIDTASFTVNNTPRPIKLFLKSGRGVTLSASNEVIQSPDNVVATTFLLTWDCRARNIVPEALHPRCVSLMDANRAGWYVRHRGYYLYVDSESATNNLPLFQKESSFILHTDTFYPGYYAFQSVNYPRQFIRLRDGRRLGIEIAIFMPFYIDTASFTLNDASGGSSGQTKSESGKVLLDKGDSKSPDDVYATEKELLDLLQRKIADD